MARSIATRTRPPEARENAIQTAVLAHWRTLPVLGSLVAACPNAGALGQPGLTAGLFDLIVMSPTLGVKTGWLELKRESRRNEKDGGLSDGQLKFRSLCEILDVPHAVVYGRDEPIEVLRAWGAVR